MCWYSNIWRKPELQDPEVTLTTDTHGEVIWGPRDGSNTWTSTWWQDNGGGNYDDFGTVCGAY